MPTAKRPAKKYKVISLFAGCGGLDLGFRGDFEFLKTHYSRTNFEVILANDIDKNAALTYRKNFEQEIICEDLNELLKTNFKFPKTDVLLGGFPCQDFSLSGKRKGFNSERGKLYKAMAKTISQTRPAIFVAENVKGLLSAHNGKAIKIIEKDFEKLGYHISTNLYLVANYGVPQRRERVIIIGTDKKKLPKFNHLKPILSKEEWVLLKKAIGDLANKKEGSVPNHFWSKAKMFKGTQGNSTISSNKIGPTMRSEHHGNIEWHWNNTRRLSAREAARIQSFPDNFIFYPSTSSAYKQIGNAVPPVMGWHIAKAIESFLDKNLK